MPDSAFDKCGGAAMKLLPCPFDQWWWPKGNIGADLLARDAARAGWNAALAAAVRACEERAKEHRELNRKIRSKPDYDETGSDGDCAALCAAQARECELDAAAIKHLASDAGAGTSNKGAPNGA